MQLIRFTDDGLRALFCPASLRTGRMSNSSQFLSYHLSLPPENSRA
ncbi:hypothetical protein EaACW_3184 [Erwinia amylovora ACW56400]|uniref:Uncharacterized protein n=2 Tax=Erwinia amylovora TaxID=552 RepID=A0A831ES89_ERWAM|nr:hypothetical protein EaACW_3184 [Erwinia amylovora ACW56400]CBX82046.1 hypothetical protein predicted by Glimmer/Critica [Erwinia amylovora ATCC BAA-2158]CCO95173.1 hypothetical protein BN437_3268 [Erwinia amylovora NBRC 12687 = CFBP 1232]CCP08502.1 hypothetical protein BN440_3507 [Erwinia amylovora MR1]